ncbi:MAG: sugar phosphate isomerase/epimerase [Paraburkholderia sp.]|uniref:sugar phosphate isomerase/epimerase family protein n=1 Tax=Paraburkholderia sp. TaxID=1926495 RepID=UPI0011F5D153|nr:sugar phosphate isomerase/epimerase [Paraburkholderia sp.]TAL92858.1 MAG: sugar phosphate isomerase/epimerase [Paraburkholderia sp.]
MPDIVIVASAFGADAIRRDGHQAWLGSAATAGASAFEVRRELFNAEEDATPDALNKLGEAIDALGMWSVWSTPQALYTAEGALDLDALRVALAEGEALGARFVKLQLGGFAHEAGGAAIAACLRGAKIRLVVENGQMKEGGRLAQFVGLFAALEREGYPDVLGMTFDIGNWQWPGEAPLEAARQLAPHVEYIHCKAVTGEGARRFAVAPAADDPVCAAVLPLLPRHVPRGIEFPFDTARLQADASRHVAWLAAA